MDTVPVIDNFPPRWLEPGDPLIREDIAAAYPGERVMWGRGATDMKASDAVLLYLAANVTNPKYDLTYVFYDHEEVTAETVPQEDASMPSEGNYEDWYDYFRRFFG